MVKHGVCGFIQVHVAALISFQSYYSLADADIKKALMIYGSGSTLSRKLLSILASKF